MKKSKKKKLEERKDFWQKAKERGLEFPVKRGLTIDEIITKYPMTVRILLVQLVEQIDRLKKKAELPEITEAWAVGKAKEILDMIKQAQDEDLGGEAQALHWLGLCMDLVTSIIEEYWKELVALGDKQSK